MADRDLDAEFERIIAGWDDEAPDPQLLDPQRLETPHPEPSLSPATQPPTDAASAEGPSPDEPVEAAAEGADPTGSALALDPSPAEPSAAPDATAPPGDRVELPIAPTTSHTWRGSAPQRDDADDLLDATDPDEDHFVPPSEIDLPSAETDPMFWAIVGGLVGGPLLLLYVLFFDRDGSGWWVTTALAMVVVGFVLLVLRGGTERDPFDDGTRV